jgi:DNA-binding transcriptional ArsR family regulator
MRLPCSWSDDTLLAAKLLGKCEPATLSPFVLSTGNEQPEKYYARINALRDAGLDIRPANESNFDLGRQETASLHLAHKHQSRDENLNRYTNPVRKKHFKVLRRLEQKLQPVFEAAGNAPWSEQRKNYIGRAKIKEILELRSQGVKIAEIARKIVVSPSTIYRHLPQDSVGNDEAVTKDQ